MASRSTTVRARPNQARSRATFDKILATAAELLEEVGWDGFNTNLLAERAGYRVSGVYRYFPNKLAVVATLAERMTNEWDDWATGFDAELGKRGDVKAVWALYVREFPNVLRAQRGGVAIRRAMQASPVLREIDKRDNALLAERLAGILARVAPHLDRKSRVSAARVLMESVTALVDVILEASPAEAKRLMDEALEMHDAYFDRLAARK